MKSKKINEEIEKKQEILNLYKYKTFILGLSKE
ncbi:hypothetical protein VAMP_84n10 [Candidatus Vampirococcus lugosii]|uniref:Uncharacterized protein n=1 Tax=Candidatus Vampirococcus lugosii TaxID=2789015 RepID=A0ABS5QLJ1_9BACT|nr:hypothetical protein [Candidatus Vampirococcus lugosii]